MIGARLKKLREDKGLSQKDLAAILGTSQGYISDIEKRGKKPGTDFLVSLKRFFEIDLWWFLTGESSENEIGDFLVTDHQDLDYRNTPTALKISKMVREMDDEMQREILKYVEEKKLLSELLAERKKTGK